MIASPSVTSPVIRSDFGAIRPTAEPARTIASGSIRSRRAGVSPPPQVAPAARHAPMVARRTRVAAKDPEVQAQFRVGRELRARVAQSFWAEGVVVSARVDTDRPSGADS